MTAKRTAKIIPFLIAALLLMVAFAGYFLGGAGSLTASAGSGGKAVSISTSQKYLEDFLKDNKKRKSLTEGEEKAADWIRKEAEDIAGASTDFKIEKKAFTFNDGTQEQTSYNISVKFKYGQSRDTVVIGAVYGNVSESEGAYYNGSSVAVMLSLIEYFANNPSDPGYVIEFIFFGAAGYLNSADEYLESLADLSKILMYIDLDGVGGGDNLYVYADEVKRGHFDKYMETAAGYEGEEFRKIPADITITTLTLAGFPYLHWGLSGTHALFMQSNIPVLHLFGMNLSVSNKEGYVESAKHPAIIGTDDDNLETLGSYYPGYAARLDRIAEVTAAYITDPGFPALAAAAREDAVDYRFWLNTTYAALFAMGITALAIVAVMLLGMYFKKKYPPKAPAVIVVKKLPVFGEEYEKHNIPNPPPPPPGNGNGPPPIPPFSGY